MPLVLIILLAGLRVEAPNILLRRHVLIDEKVIEGQTEADGGVVSQSVDAVLEVKLAVGLTRCIFDGVLGDDAAEPDGTDPRPSLIDLDLGGEKLTVEGKVEALSLSDRPVVLWNKV